nr:ERI1 exoribonuclease 2 isoform X2 [Nothobranchius furzeri]
MQVEAGIPLQICLSRFNRWLQNLQLEKGVTFPNKQQTCSASVSTQKLCTFLTWSDWDLGVCLQYECKRKQLLKPEVLNNWIDLRSTYRLFYNRKPKGLNGALQDLGIQFSGREHSGLDDSRNTARLAQRMMRDGCVMKITRSLERTSVMVKPMCGSSSRPVEDKKGNLNTSKRETVVTTSKLSSSKVPLKNVPKHSRLEPVPRDLDTKGNSSCQSLISPKTLLSISTAPLHEQKSRPDTPKAAASCTSTGTVNGSHVLCSTTVSCFSNQALQTSQLGEEDAEPIVEPEGRCGSYDDVVLECDDAVRDTEGEHDVEYVSDFDSGCYELEEPDHSWSPEGHVTLGDLKENNQRKQNIICKSKNWSESNTLFAVPKTINWSTLNQRKVRCMTSPDLQSNLGFQKTKQTNVVSPVNLKPFLPEKTSTPNTSTARQKPEVPKWTEPWKVSITKYPEPKEKASGSSHRSSFGSRHIPNVLSSLSTNTSSFSANRSCVSFTSVGQQKITSPLCACGRRSKRQVVSNGGPNHGRGFYCCPVRRSGGRGLMEKGCDFFKWESALMKSDSMVALVEGSSISVGQINPTLLNRRC